MKSNNSPINNKGKKNFSPPMKIGKTKHVLGKTVLEKIKTHKPNLKEN